MSGLKKTKERVFIRKNEAYVLWKKTQISSIKGKHYMLSPVIWINTFNTLVKLPYNSTHQAPVLPLRTLYSIISIFFSYVSHLVTVVHAEALLVFSPSRISSLMMILWRTVMGDSICSNLSGKKPYSFSKEVITITITRPLNWKSKLIIIQMEIIH